jgi:uncharacterized protein (TIRG00374 family)
VSRLKLALGIAISIALFALLLSKVDPHLLTEQLASTHWGWVFVAAFLAPAGLWVRAQRWRYLFPPRSDPPGLVPAMMIGYMANNVLPLRAGEIVRVYVVARRWRRGFWTALGTLVVERLLDSLVIVMILGVLILMIPVPPIIEAAAITFLAIDVAAVTALVALAVAPSRCQALLRAVVRRWPAVERRASRILETFLAGLEGVRTARHLLPLLLWTAATWLVPALAAWTMLRAMNLHLPFIAGWTVMTFVGLGVSIPSAPGYIGVFHTAAVLALAIFGVSDALGAGYALVFHASQFVPVTLVGWIFLLREHVSLGEATRARPDERAGGAAAR